MIPELIGRLPIIATLNQLSEGDLARILTEPRDALTRQYRSPISLRRRPTEIR